MQVCVHVKVTLITSRHHRSPNLSSFILTVELLNGRFYCQIQSDSPGWVGSSTPLFPRGLFSVRAEKSRRDSEL